MRTALDLLALALGLVADLFRKEGPLRRAPRTLFGAISRRRVASSAGRPDERDGDDRDGAGEERLTELLIAVSSAPSVALSWAGRGLRRTRDVGIHAVRTGIDGASRTTRRSLDGSRPQVGALADAISRSVAGLARSVLALPGGPVPVTVAAVVVLVLAAFSWTQPTDSDRVQMRPFVVEYAFDYRAELPPNVVYEDRSLRFGDPVFLGVIDTVDLSVDWSVPRGDVVVSGGRLAVTTVLRSEAGWTRVIERVPEVSVEGLAATSSVTLDFPSAIELARRVDEATGVSRPVRLEVLVETLLDDPVAPTGGAGTPVDGYSSATLSFALDEQVVRLVDVPVAAPRSPSDGLAGIIPGTGSASTETGGASTETGGASSGTGGASSESGGASTGTGRTSTETGSTSRFSQAGPGTVAADGRVGVREVVQMFATDVLEPNQLRLGPLRMEVGTARRNLTLLGLLLLASGLLGLRVLRRIEEHGEAAVIEARYGPMLTPLPIGVNGHGAHAIDVGSFDALHALALDRDTPIMVDRAHRPGAVAHYLFDGPTTYRYVAQGRSLAPGKQPLGVDIPLDEDGVAVDAGGPTPASGGGACRSVGAGAPGSCAPACAAARASVRG